MLAEHRRSVGRHRINVHSQGASSLHETHRQNARRDFENAPHECRQAAQLANKVIVFLVTPDFLPGSRRAFAIPVAIRVKHFIDRLHSMLKRRQLATRSLIPSQKNTLDEHCALAFQSRQRDQKKILWGQKKYREKTAAKHRKQHETRITRFRG
ncbi:MAG: hypothetical protein EPN75_07480 [Beijerinckiaceae bacterium]|nr:MAG: hypothetical protein EPN75_07480 [Beijerinckiaceae bacterium]